MSQIKKINNRMEVTPTKEQLGGIKPAEKFDEVVTLGQLNGFGLLKSRRVYKALISQSGTDAPTAIVLENSIGAIVWTRNNTGSYFGTLAGAFTENKTFCLGGVNAGANMIVGIQRGDGDTIYLSSIDAATDLTSDSLLYLTSILIEVYQ